ncbi:hypothetical protein [Mobiluncus mulieris]|uniref:hypothetical protein n=1 Tax=Mobiluncus mulieris TaxID=2052 RepID=UPI002093194C|nr:hypothetical protein [Mobiluncus mulieris]
MMNFGKKMAVGVASAALVASLAGVPAAVAVLGMRLSSLMVVRLLVFLVIRVLIRLGCGGEVV